MLRCKFCPALRSRPSKKYSAEYSAQRPHLHLLLLPRRAVPLLVGTMVSQKSNNTKNSGPDGKSRGTSFGGVVCFYYHKPDHVIRDCKKWQSRNQRFQFAHVASFNETSDQSVQFIAEELVRFHFKNH